MRVISFEGPDESLQDFSVMVGDIKIMSLRRDDLLNPLGPVFHRLFFLSLLSLSDIIEVVIAYFLEFVMIPDLYV